MSEKRFKSPIENALRGCQFGLKLGRNRGYPYWFLTPKERVLLFQVPDVSAKFRRNRFKIATVRARTHTHTEITQVILLSVPCYAIAMGQIIILPICLFSVQTLLSKCFSSTSISCQYVYVLSAIFTVVSLMYALRYAMYLLSTLSLGCWLDCVYIHGFTLRYRRRASWEWQCVWMCVCFIGDKWTDLTIEKATGIVVGTVVFLWNL